MKHHENLVIGGSVFLGRAIVEKALRRGHEATTFNRGRSGADLPGVEAVRGNREVSADLAHLADGRAWDLVVDVCGFIPRAVGEPVLALNGKAATYALISSISACAGWPSMLETDESSPRFE
jgi:2'-hydroxyisoflavone reductase